MRRVLAWMPNLWQSRLSVLGVAISVVSGGAIALVLIASAFSDGGSDYAETIIAGVALLCFVLGLILIPIGLYRARRRAARAGAAGADAATPVAKNLLFFVGATLVNILLLGGVGYKAMTFMETARFCGTTCHGVMQPEYEANARSPHAHVECISCHVGAGAGALVESKIAGMRQLWHLAMGSYSRPVPAPVRPMRKSVDTCAHCHTPDAWVGNKLFMRSHTREEPGNAAFVNALVVHVGGKSPTTGAFEGIHWHRDPNVQVRYEALDGQRGKIGKIEVLKGGQLVTEYLPPPGTKGEVFETRVMECADCHNRIGHALDGSAVAALDMAFARRALDRKVPELRKLALPILQDVTRSHDGLDAVYRKELDAAYLKAGITPAPDGPTLDRAAKGLADVYRRNVFPDMKVAWGTYRRHDGHGEEIGQEYGCFRCHDEKHKTAAGKALSQDCEMCHQMMAQEEDPEKLEEPMKSLLGNR